MYLMAKKLSKKAQTKLEAKAKIVDFLKQAEKQGKKVAKNYVKKAKRLSMKYRVSLPTPMKKRFCKHCLTWFQFGENCRVRVTKKNVVYYCMECKHHMRFPHKKRTTKVRIKSARRKK